MGNSANHGIVWSFHSLVYNYSFSLSCDGILVFTFDDMGHRVLDDPITQYHVWNVCAYIVGLQ